MEGLFLDLTVLLSLAAGFGLIMHLLRQPPILGYIATGILLASVGILGRGEQIVFESLADIGIALLLFMVGLEMNVRDLKSVGVASLATGLGQILFTTTIGTLIALQLGFSLVPALYIALALSFSSTIIIVNLLSQKHDLDSLYGKIAVGFLLIQDFVAIVALVLLSGFSTSHGISLNPSEVVLVLAKGAVLFSSVLVLSQTLIPYLTDRLARSPELLFITSIAWAFAVAAFTASPLIGFSVEIGGFLAGLALANSIEHVQIAARIRPLRDFFIVLFFVLLGMQLGFGSIGQVWQPAVLFSLVVLIGNPLIVFILMALLRFRTRTAFLAGLTVAQISEFSLILIALGIKLGHLPPEIITLMTLVAIITMTLSAYLVLEGDRVYQLWRPILIAFQRKQTVEGKLDLPGPPTNHTLIIGGHRTAENVLKALEQRETNLLVVDFDPAVVERLKSDGIPVLFGDISDPDIQEQAGMFAARLVISTVTDPADTTSLLTELKRKRTRAKVLVTAQDLHEAKEFYRLGADYVLLPHFVSGEHIADIVTDAKFSDRIKRLKEKHQARLAGSNPT